MTDGLRAELDQAFAALAAYRSGVPDVEWAKATIQVQLEGAGYEHQETNEYGLVTLKRGDSHVLLGGDDVFRHATLLLPIDALPLKADQLGPLERLIAMIVPAEEIGRANQWLEWAAAGTRGATIDLRGYRLSFAYRLEETPKQATLLITRLDYLIPPPLE